MNTNVMVYFFDIVYAFSEIIEVLGVNVLDDDGLFFFLYRLRFVEKCQPPSKPELISDDIGVAHLEENDNRMWDEISRIFQRSN